MNKTPLIVGDVHGVWSRLNDLINKKQPDLTSAHPFWGGGFSEEATVVPIPNTVVKLLSAYGTARATAWQSRSPPPQSPTKKPGRK